MHKCSRCGAEESEPIPAKGHKWSDWAQTKAPTCTAKGTETRTCANCKTTETHEIDALGHNPGAWTQTKAPTCTEKGVETSTCSRCGKATTRELPALGLLQQRRAGEERQAARAHDGGMAPAENLGGVQSMLAAVLPPGHAV